MNDDGGIGARVRQAMEHKFGDRDQKDVAADLGLTNDKFSKSLNGLRAFSTAELARAADLFGADLHELITGRPDPLRPSYAARHDYNPATRDYSNAGQDGDTVRDGVFLAYQQAHPWLAADRPDLPATPEEMRQVLGEDFVRTFVDRAERAFGVDVVRLPRLATDYSVSIAGQRVIVLKTEPNWFRANWSLAHELAHLALGHHESEHQHQAHENEANDFAASLLLPRDSIRSIDWTSASPATVADYLWETGVSTVALTKRLRFLNVEVSPHVWGLLSGSTQSVLNGHGNLPTGRELGPGFFAFTDPIAERMRGSAERRVPLRLVGALRKGIENGPLNGGTLAWLLDVAVEDLGIDEGTAEHELSDDDLDALLGL